MVEHMPDCEHSHSPIRLCDCPAEPSIQAQLDRAVELLGKLADAADACSPRYEDAENQVQDRVNEARAFLATMKDETT